MLSSPAKIWMQRSVAISAVLLSAGPAAAQENKPEETPRQAVVRQFERDAPAIGEPLPDIELYDARGKPVRLAELRGNYTVLVFGCLT